MLDNPEYAFYTADNIKIKKLSSDFLLNLVAYMVLSYIKILFHL